MERGLVEKVWAGLERDRRSHRAERQSLSVSLPVVEARMNSEQAIAACKEVLLPLAPHLSRPPRFKGTFDFPPDRWLFQAVLEGRWDFDKIGFPQSLAYFPNGLVGEAPQCEAAISELAAACAQLARQIQETEAVWKGWAPEQVGGWIQFETEQSVVTAPGWRYEDGYTDWKPGCPAFPYRVLSKGIQAKVIAWSNRGLRVRLLDGTEHLLCWGFYDRSVLLPLPSVLL